MSARRGPRRPWRPGWMSAGKFPWLSWSIETAGAAVVLSVSGTADVETASVFARALDDATSCGLPVILDCANVDRMDGTGLDVLVEYRQRVPRMLLARPAACIRTAVDTQFLGAFFPAYDSLDAAAAALGPASPPPLRAGCDHRRFGRWQPAMRRHRGR